MADFDVPQAGVIILYIIILIPWKTYTLGIIILRIHLCYFSEILRTHFKP